MSRKITQMFNATLATALAIAGLGSVSAQDDSFPSAGAGESAPLAETPVATEAPLASDASATSKSASPSASRLIEEIVVTAAKREEAIQTVPIAISAFSGAKLDAVGILSPHDLPKLTPGLTFTSSAAYNIVYLRGVGSDAFLPAADQNVPTYLDGVALVQGEGSQDSLGRVERVEVLKGPQGTLFGRNSTGGAISIITPDPGPEYEGDFTVGFGSEGKFEALGFMNIPITDDLAATISGYNHTRDTYLQNDPEVGPTVDTYSRGARTKIKWHMRDDLSFNVAGLYGETSDNASMAKENIRVAAYLAAIIPEDPKADRNIRENVIGGIVQYNWLFSGGWDWRLPWIQIKGIASDQKVFATYANYDYDGSTTPFVSFRPIDQFGRQKTGEIQFLSQSDMPLSEYVTFVAGVYYLEGEGGFPTLQLNVSGDAYNSLPGARGLIDGINQLALDLGLPLPPIGGAQAPATAVSGGILTSESLSGYFQSTLHLQQFFDLSRELNVILGIRVQEETRGLKNNRLGALNPLNNDQEITFFRFSVPDIKEKQLPLKFGFQWYPWDETQLYTSFSRGFTAPTYNTVNFFSAPDRLKAQETDSYEIGIKTKLFDDTVTFNAAVFYIKQQELLTGFASITSGGVVRFDNVPRARIYGGEFDLTWQPMREINPGLVILGSFCYLDAQYEDYPDARGYDAQSGLSYGQGALLSARDASGNDIVRTPPITYTVAINQSIPLGSSNKVELAIETNYSDEFFYDPMNTPEYANPAFQLYDARATWFYQPWGLELTAYGRNLTDDKYYKSLFLLDPGMNVVLNDPRTFGLRLKYVF